MNNNTLEHLEKASVDELRNVQFERIKQTLQHENEMSERGGEKKGRRSRKVC